MDGRVVTRAELAREGDHLVRVRDRVRVRVRVRVRSGLEKATTWLGLGQG